MQKKMPLLAIAAIVSIGLIGSFFFLPLLIRPRVSLKGKVESFYVHFENGENMTVYPSTSEGAKLLSACEDFMSNIYGQWMWAVTDKELSYLNNCS